MPEQLPLFALPIPATDGKAAAVRRWRPDLRRVRLGDLPPAYREIAGVIGLQAALALVDWRGGSTIKVPRKPRPHHPLTHLLGHAGATALARHMGGDRLTVPSLKSIVAPARNRAIRADYDAGVRMADLVRRFGCSERRIRDILNEAQ